MTEDIFPDFETAWERAKLWRFFDMCDEANIDPGGQHVKGEEAHGYYSEHVDPSSSREVVGNAAFPQYMVADDSEWVRRLSDVAYDDTYQFQDLQNIEEQAAHTEEVYLLTDEEKDMETVRNSVDGLQVAANEVVIDDMLANTTIGPQDYVAAIPEEGAATYPQQYVRTSSERIRLTAQPQPVGAVPYTNKLRYIMQNVSSALEMRPNQSVHYEVRPTAMFEGPSNQSVSAPPQHAVPILRSRSKSQPRRPLYREMEDESLAYLVQEYDEGEWDGVELEDHEYFIGGPDEREAIVLAEDQQEQSYVPPPKTLQRPYFPPNLSPTEKKDYLLVNYKKACDRYFPFANVALLESDTRYRPVEAFASDLYRFHSRGAHIHGFFRTVIDTRDRPSHDQTRYIQDIQFGKVFPLFPDYEEWDDSMRNEFRQLTNRLMQIFERKCFYACTGSGHGKAPIIRRGPRPVQKPPPDYAEQQKIQYKGIPKGFQPLKSSIATQMRTFSTRPTSQSAITMLPDLSTTKLKPLSADDSVSEAVVVPHELGTPRLEAYQHNKRANIKRLVNDAFVSRERATLHCEEPLPQRSSDPCSFFCRMPAGPSKTLRHQRSTASKAIRMIANRTIEPAIDPATGRYVVSLDELRSQDHAAAERLRYVQRPLHSLREMADSARRGGSSNWTAAGHPQGERVSRIDQSPRFTKNPTHAGSSTQQQNLSCSSGGNRAPLLRNLPATAVTRKPGVLTGNAVTTATSSLSRSDHVYLRSHSSGRRAAPISSIRRSASSGRPMTQSLHPRLVTDEGDRIQSFVHAVNDFLVVDKHNPDPEITITDENQTNVHQMDKCSSSLTSSEPSQTCDQSISRNTVQTTLGSGVMPNQKPQKRIVLLRDSHGQLRRVTRLPDGTLLLRDRPPGNLVSQLGRVSTELRPGVEVQRPRSPKAGTVWDVQSIVGKSGKRAGNHRDQRRQSNVVVSSWNHSTVIPGCEKSHQNQNIRNSDLKIQPKTVSKMKSKRKDALYLDDDNEVVVISGQKRGKPVKGVVKPQKHLTKSVLLDKDVCRKSKERTAKPVSRLSVVDRPHLPAEQGSVHRRVVEQQDDLDDSIVDVVGIDDILEGAIKALIASVPPSAPSDIKEQSVHGRKKAGRPPKKFRGRLAKQKQAIRDAEIAEKVAIKQRELPVLDLTLKVIDNPTVELPLEAPIVVDSTIIHDTALLHEVGEVLKELVAQVCLEELQPKRDIKSRSRRCWEHLPERVRSKRQEYRNLNIPIAQRSPPPPPLRSKPRGRNSEKYRQALLERTKQQREESAAASIPDVEPSPPWESNSLCTSQDRVAETRSKESEDDGRQASFEHGFSLSSKSQLEMRSTWDEDFQFSGLEDFDLNEDDLVDINVDTFFTSAENLDTYSGDEGDSPSQRMRQKLRTFLGDVVHLPRIPSSKIEPIELEKISSEAGISENGMVPDVVCENPPDHNSEDFVDCIVEDILEMIIAHVSLTVCHSYSCRKEQIEQRIKEEQQNQIKESSSLVSVDLSLEKNESSETFSYTFANKNTESLHGDYLSCYHHIGIPTSISPEVNGLALADVTLDVFGMPCNILNINELTVEDAATPACAASSYQVSSNDVMYIRTTYPFPFKEDGNCSSSCDTAHFESAREDEHYFHSGVVDIAEVAAESLNLAPEMSFGFARTEFSFNDIEEESFEVQKDFIGFSSSNQQWIHSIHTVDTVFSRSGEDAQVYSSLPNTNMEVDLLNITSSDFSLFPSLRDPFESLIFGSLLETDQEFEGISSSTTATFPVSAEECCSFSNISMSNVIESGREPENVCVPLSVSCSEQESTALSTVQIDCCFAIADEYRELEDLIFLKDSDFLEICQKITPMEWKITADEIFSSEEVPLSTNDLQMDKTSQESCEESVKQLDVGAAKDAMVESELFACDAFGNLIGSSDNERSSTSSVVLSQRNKDRISRRRTSKGHYVLPCCSATTESGSISRYLHSEDPPGSGFSPITYLEQCFIQSPDLFGIQKDTKKRKRKKKSSVSTSGDKNAGPITRSKARRLKAGHERNDFKFASKKTNVNLGKLWRRANFTASEGRFGATSDICRYIKAVEPSQCEFLQNVKYVIRRRRYSHIISDFNVTTISPKNPIVSFEPDMTALFNSVHPVSPIRLSRPRFEGSLESAFIQYETGVKCILEQVKSARSMIENIRSTSHWTLHFLMDVQLFMLDIHYELWEYLTRFVQLGVFNVYQCTLWETHHQLFDARMHSLLFEMNAAAALSSQVELCSSYIRRFEEWNRRTNNFSSIYNNAHGLALSLFRFITIPNALARLQSMTHWNSKERPSKASEELFFVDLVPFFEVGTCSVKATEFEIERMFHGAQSLECDSLEHLISHNVAQNNSADGFSFLFPSFAVLALCKEKVQKEISLYYNSHVHELLHKGRHRLSLLSPMSRAYVLSRFHESRVKCLMQNNIMNLNKLIIKLNAIFDDLKASVDRMDQVEFDYPYGQVVFCFDDAKVSVSMNTLITDNANLLDPESAEEGHRIMGNVLKTVFNKPTIINEEKEIGTANKRSRLKKSFDLVKNWVMTVSSTYDDVHCESKDVDMDFSEPIKAAYPNSPAHVTVIEDEDDESDDVSLDVPKQKKKCCDIDTVTTTIAGRRIQYSVNCADGVLKMKTMDSVTNEASTDNLTATNTITTASFNSFDQIETLKIIRFHDTGEFNWTAMIENALDAVPPPQIMPAFLRSGLSDYQTLDVMKAHEHANHFVREIDEDGEFIDLRKEQREKIRQFQHVDYFERKRNARFEAINSGTMLEIPIPRPGERDKIPLYASWISEVVRYADIERKRMTQLKPINNVGRCRAARSEMIRDFDVPCKRRKRSSSTFPWFGRTIFEHFGDDLSLGMARLEYEISGQKMRTQPQFGSHDDTITHYFISRNNSPSTMVDPLELLENPYSFFHHKAVSRKRNSPPLVESSLVKRLCLSDPPIFAPLASFKEEPETLYPPCNSDSDSSGDDI